MFNSQPALYKNSYKRTVKNKNTNKIQNFLRTLQNENTDEDESMNEQVETFNTMSKNRTVKNRKQTNAEPLQQLKPKEIKETNDSDSESDSDSDNEENFMNFPMPSITSNRDTFDNHDAIQNTVVPPTKEMYSNMNNQRLPPPPTVNSIENFKAFNSDGYEPYSSLETYVKHKPATNFVPSINNQTNHGIVGNKDVFMDRLNYMIHLLEEQKDTKTEYITEELILYSFLGIFVIFVLDSFVKVGKYSR